MAGFSTYTQQKVLDQLTGKVQWTKPTCYIGLYTAAPTDAGGGTETTYTGYGRVATAAADWNSASGTAVSNLNAFQFGTCTAGTATIVAVGLFDAATGGNLLAWTTASLAIAVNTTPRIEAGQLTITLD